MFHDEAGTSLYFPTHYYNIFDIWFLLNYVFANFIARLSAQNEIQSNSILFLRVLHPGGFFFFYAA